MVATVVKIGVGVIAVGVIVTVATTLSIVIPRNRAKEETSTERPPEPDITKPGVPDDNTLPYRVGVGIADMTGPPVEVNFMGYAEFSQSGLGIHTRQFSRAYIFEREGTRVVFVVADIQAVGIAVRRQVVQNLQDLYNDMYSLRNVIIAGTHTHSAPGGHLVEFLLDVSILGFSQESYDAYVDGITRSIIRAHEAMVPARLFYSQTVVTGAHVNRSPYSYMNNPNQERQRYQTNTDNTLTQVRIEKADGTLHGVINWFAVHTTSMNNSNHLISSDNLGYAAIAMEKHLNPGKLVGQPDIVTAFTPSSLGDVSPNTEGARCEISGDECDNQFLICDIIERCFASGPGADMFQSTRLIGTYIYEGAMSALSAVGVELDGDLGVVHQFVDMPAQTVPRYNTITNAFESSNLVSGCVPALGYSFASGTTDGANVLNITQGTFTGNELIDSIVGIIMRPEPEDITCHAPKPILLPTGRINVPFEWHPRIISVSLINLGGLIIAGVPGEPTTMSGRRITNVITRVLEERQVVDPKVVVSGIVNEYIHYVATIEEYEIQRYEAASTIYGPNTLDIFLNKFREFTEAVLDGTPVAAGPDPVDNRGRTISLIPLITVDRNPVGRNYGDVLRQPTPQVTRGNIVSANFVAANPRNDPRQEGSHLLVERYDSGQWVVVARDAEWETKFIWERTFSLFGNSRVTIEWAVPNDAVVGEHRIRYFGAALSSTGEVTQFEGVTNNFTVS